MDLVDYRNPDTRWLLPVSASGGAVLLRRGGARHVLEETAFLVDPEMADEVFVPGGGTEIPFRPDNLNTSIMFYNTPRPEKVRDYLAGRWIEALAEIAVQALSARPADYLALRHLAPAQRRELLSRLGIDSEQSPALDAWGCHGTNDVLLALDLGVKNGAVREGTRVLMVGAGIGFTYAAAVIRWGTAGA